MYGEELKYKMFYNLLYYPVKMLRENESFM